MKRKDKDDLKSKDITALEKKAAELTKELAALKIETGLGRAKNPHSYGQKRKDLAKVKTFLNLKIKSQKQEGGKNAAS